MTKIRKTNVAEDHGGRRTFLKGGGGAKGKIFRQTPGFSEVGKMEGLKKK